MKKENREEYAKRNLTVGKPVILNNFELNTILFGLKLVTQDKMTSLLLHGLGIEMYFKLRKKIEDALGDDRYDRPETVKKVEKLLEEE